MADSRVCGNPEPHDYHGWDEVAPSAPLGKKFHVCPGIAVQCAATMGMDLKRCELPADHLGAHRAPGIAWGWVFHPADMH